MLIVNCITLLLLSCIHAGQAVPELVWLEDLNNDHHHRHLEMGLPNYLEFNLKRESGNKLKLRLEENVRLNANAPVYEVIQEDGKQKAKKLAVPITNAKFYLDKATGAAVKIQCKKQPHGACQRVLEGSLNIDEDNYEIKPSPTMLTAREMGIQTDVPHLIVKIELPAKSQLKDRIQGLYVADNKLVKDHLNGEEFSHDHIFIEDLVPARPNISDELADDNMVFPEYIPKPNIQPDLIDELRSFLGKQLYEDSRATDQHIIVSNEPLFEPQGKEGVAGLFGTLSKRMEDNSRYEASKHDHVFITDQFPDELNVTWTSGQYQELIPEGIPKPNELVDELRTLLSEEDSGDEAKDMFVKNRRQKRAEGDLVAVEVVIVIDPSVWKKYLAVTEANNGMNKETATEYFIRERFSNVINGVSLRFESIEDTELNVYVTISEFLLYKEVSLFSESINIQVVDGVEYASSDKYIARLPAWASTAPITKHSDHIMVVTGYDLYYGGNTANDEIAGVTFVSGACGYYRTSVQEDSDYFVITSVAAHELGHK